MAFFFSLFQTDGVKWTLQKKNVVVFTLRSSCSSNERWSSVCVSNALLSLLLFKSAFLWKFVFLDTLIKFYAKRVHVRVALLEAVINKPISLLLLLLLLVYFRSCSGCGKVLIYRDASTGEPTLVKSSGRKVPYPSFGHHIHNPSPGYSLRTYQPWELMFLLFYFVCRAGGLALL